MTYTDRSPAPEKHAEGCFDWCNHCAICGEGILYGARCQDHLGMYPEREGS